jgi:hypothetical protein
MANATEETLVALKTQLAAAGPLPTGSATEATLAALSAKLPAAAAPSDAGTNDSTTSFLSRLQAWTGSAWRRLLSTSTGALRTTELDVETVVIDLSGASPGTVTTAAGANSFAAMADLAACRNIEIQRTIQGATGGPTDIYLRTSADTTNGADGTWTDWARFAQQTAGLGATTKRIPLALTNTAVSVGTGSQTTGMALAVDTYVGGHPGKCVCVVYVTGATVTVGAAQTIKLIATRPKA